MVTPAPDKITARDDEITSDCTDPADSVAADAWAAYSLTRARQIGGAIGERTLGRVHLLTRTFGTCTLYEVGD